MKLKSSIGNQRHTQWMLNRDGWYDVFDCFMCEGEIPEKDRKTLTTRILGELQLVFVCDTCKNQVPQHYLWKKIEEIEHIFFLKRLARPLYGWKEYWEEYYQQKRREAGNVETGVE